MVARNNSENCARVLSDKFRESYLNRSLLHLQRSRRIAGIRLINRQDHCGSPNICLSVKYYCPLYYREVAQINCLLIEVASHITEIYHTKYH
jgi:hypothetical protein